MTIALAVSFHTTLEACQDDVCALGPRWPIGHVPQRSSRIQFNGYQLEVVEVTYQPDRAGDYRAVVELYPPSIFNGMVDDFNALVQRAKGGR